MPFWQMKVCTYKLYNFSVSMDWAVGCYLGRDKTIEKVSSRFYWRNINEEIRKCVQHCERCQKNECKIVPVPNVWHQVGIDLIVPMATTLNGNKCVVTLVDYFSKW